MLTELELCTNNLPLADRCMLNFFFFAGHILSGFNLFISARIKKLSTEFGGGLPKDYTAVSNRDTCLGSQKVSSVKLG